MTVQETLQNALEAVRKQFDADALSAADTMRWLETANQLFALLAIVEIAQRGPENRPETKEVSRD